MMEMVKLLLPYARENAFGILLGFGLTAIIIIWLARQGFLAWSKDKVQIVRDSAHIDILESLRDEIRRLTLQLETERAYCQVQLQRLTTRIEALENRNEY